MLVRSRLKRLRFEEALVAVGALDEEEVWRAVAKAAGLPFVNLGKGRIPDEILELARPHAVLLQEHRALPVVRKGNRLVVALDDPLRAFVADDLGFLFGLEIACAIAAPGPLKTALAALGGPVPRAAAARKEGPAARRAKGEDADADDAPIIRLVEAAFEEAMAARASDIHIEPFQERVRVRYRIDGILRTAANHPRHLHGALVSRLKIMAGLDIAEKRKPQDGRILVHVQEIGRASCRERV